MNLNRTGQLLPQINMNGRGEMGSGLGGGARSYKFEAGNSKPSEENKNDPGKFKGVSTRGAGFSSSSTADNSGYEPTSGQRRTPRRTLGVLLNENNGVKAQESMGSSSGMGTSAISWPSQTGNNLDGTMGGNKPPMAGNKPPMYVPGANRPPIRQSIDKKAGSGAYVSKTGFSSMGESKPAMPFEN